jgi:predicted nuclease of predicted toxin-antitoxin system
MELSFFADHCVPYSIIRSLRDAKYEVLVLKEYIPPDSPDSVVIEKAQELKAILISLNGDFADIVSYPPTEYRGIISIQVRNHPEVIPQIISRCLDFFASHPDPQFYIGKLILMEAHRIRIRSK